MPAETHTHQTPLDPADVHQLVVDHLADIKQLDVGSISGDSRIVEDLGADSLDIYELIDRLEEDLSERTVGFEVEDEDLEDLATVADIVDYVGSLVG